MSAQHTPGPWFVRTRAVVDGVIVDCFVAAPPTNGLPYDAEVLGDDEYREDDGIARKLADAHLISAAPELLGALQRLIDVNTGPKLNDEGASYRAVRDARAAIAKATGAAS